MFQWGSAGLSARAHGSEPGRTPETSFLDRTQVACFDLDRTCDQHPKITSLDRRIWRGSIDSPDVRVDGYPSWNEVISEHTRTDCAVALRTVSTWNAGPHVFCASHQHFSADGSRPIGSAEPLKLYLTLITKRGGQQCYVSS